jgi:hypothetical protein
MNKSNKWTEKIKSCLIVLLLFSAVYLGTVSGLFNGLIDSGAIDGLITNLFHRGGFPEDAKDSVKSEAAWPMSIVITNETGSHFGLKYDTVSLDSMYIKTRDTFREALGSAAVPSTTEESAWRSALRMPSIYYEYLTPVRLSMLGEWIGTSTNGDWGNTLVRRLCVAFGENGGSLYYQDEESGLFYSASTAKLGNNTSLTESYGVNSAAFVFEVPGLSYLDNPYMLLLPAITSHPVLEASNPLDVGEFQEEALAALGVSEHIISFYTEPNGTTVYVGNDDGNNFTLRLTSGGTVIYNLKDKAAELPDMAEDEAVEAARKMVSDTIGRYSGDAEVHLASITPLSSGGYTITFQYIIAGGQIYLLDDGYAAKVTVRDGIIDYMVLNFRKYKDTGVKQPLLPEIQAAAAAGGEFVLNYSDQGTEQVKPEWVKLPA